MLTKRSVEKEILDLGPNFYSVQEYDQCMKKLFSVNKLLGFFHSTKKILKKFPPFSSVLDVGCGSGLFILNLAKYIPTMNMLGVDISADAINLAKKELHVQKAELNISFQLMHEPSLISLDKKFDIILATLVCHHLTDLQLITFLQEATQCANHAVLINDLHRHKIPEFFYRIFSPLLFRNKLITHDGLISIRRGFKHSEWKLLLARAGIKNYQLKWCFPFRWRLMIWSQ